MITQLMMVYCLFVYAEKKCNREDLFKYSLRPKITMSVADGIRTIGEKQTNPPSCRQLEVPISYSELNMFFSLLKVSS